MITLKSNIANSAHKQLLYNGLDCCATFEISARCSRLVVAPEVEKIYRLNRKLQVPALIMQLRGLGVDLKERKIRLQFTLDSMKAIQPKVDKLIIALGKAERVSISSPTQLLRLFRSLGAKVKSTQEDTLERLLNNDKCHSFAELALEYRQLDKDKLVLNSKLDSDGRFHPGFNVAGTVTGRWSSSKNSFWRGNNIQNINKHLRSIFIPDPGMVFVEADYRQADSTVVAYASGDENYIEAHKRGNVHNAVAKMLFPDSLPEALAFKNLTYYDLSKRAGHACNYKVGARTLASTLHVDISVAEDFIKRYFRIFPGIRHWQNRLKSALKREGFLITPLGRRRRFFGRRSDNKTFQEALSFIPQSTVAECVNFSLLNCCQNLEPIGVQTLAHIHDSILFQVQEKTVGESIQLITKNMQIPIPFATKNVCLGVDVKFGSNWRDMKLWEQKTNLEAI